MTFTSPQRLLPLFLRLEGKPVLVVGAGGVAEKKILDLVDAGARVTVIAPDATRAVDELATSGALTLEKRPFVEEDVADVWLVIAATTDEEVQKRVCLAAEVRRTFAIAVDDPPNGSAYSASVIRRGPITIAISTSGEAPALSRLLREVLERALPEEAWVDAAKELRERWKREGTPMVSRFGELVRAFKERAG